MKVTKQTKQVENLVDEHFPNCPRDLPRAYRYNPASIRVRIVDPRFKDKNRSEREKMVMAIVRTLPEETRQELTVLLLLTPDELADSLMNRQFEHPD